MVLASQIIKKWTKAPSNKKQSMALEHEFRMSIKLAPAIRNFQ